MWKVLVLASGPAAGSWAAFTVAIVRICVRKTGRDAANSLEVVRRAAMVGGVEMQSGGVNWVSRSKRSVLQQEGLATQQIT